MCGVVWWSWGLPGGVVGGVEPHCLGRELEGPLTPLVRQQQRAHVVHHITVCVHTPHPSHDYHTKGNRDDISGIWAMFHQETAETLNTSRKGELRV